MTNIGSNDPTRGRNGSTNGGHTPKYRHTSPADNPICTGTNGNCKGRSDTPTKQVTQLGDQVIVSSGGNNEPLSSCILREGSTSASSSARDSRGRDLIPLTPEISHLLDRMEPDKRKQPRLLTYHLTGQRSLPSTESDGLPEISKGNMC